MEAYMNCWDILDIEPTVDLKVIKKAYDSNLKLYHPEVDLKGFEILEKHMIMH
jgi:curved DNA-binding protein CbpA